MNKIFLILLMSIFVLGGINAAGLAQICIDKDPPSLMNSSLTLTATNNNINLNWIAATDIPNCSGISHYEIYRSQDGINFTKITSTPHTEYEDKSLQYDITYYYMIHAFDKVNHIESEEALSNWLYLSSPTPEAPGPSGGGGREVSYWECGGWSECVNGTQTRTCVDISGGQPNRTETKECFLEFVPLGQGSNESETVSVNQQGTNFLTGAVIGVIDFVKSGAGIITIFASLIVVIGAFIVVKLNLIKRKK